MSRIGKYPVPVPAGVEVTISGQDLKVKGKLGELSLRLHDEVSAQVENAANDSGHEGKVVALKPKSESRMARQIWPTMRTLVANMVEGVNTGYKRKLMIQGVGYRANLQGQELVMTMGFSHEIRYKIPVGIQLKVDNQTEIEITGIDKQKVGQVAAKIRGYKPPEPYKGKGIRYSDEYVRRKEGKKK
ncbi:MAG: 50S ribosomal protein L6 [Alphaproteobacteria bacterium]|nr:50S ribosomal protein L6 [Alphaproteobacteria bacterium]